MHRVIGKARRCDGGERVTIGIANILQRAFALILLIRNAFVAPAEM